MPESPENQRPLSAILADAGAHEGARISVAELAQLFGGRAIGALLFMFGLACLLPLPPGATTIFGFPLVLLAPQLIVGAAVPWLPTGLKNRTISTADLNKGLPRLLKGLTRIEAVSKPRLAFLFNPVAERVMGLVILALALVLILPIPGGNILPALAVSALAFALIQRDGVIALVGYAIAITSASVLVLAANIIIRMFAHFWSVIAPG